MPYKHVLVSLLAAGSLAGVTPAAALAQAGGSGGGATAPEPPAARSATCLDSPGAPCSGRSLLRGRSFVVRGSRLENVTRVVFGGRRGASAGVVKRTSRYAIGVVPQSARSGRLTLIDRWGNEATTTFGVSVRDAPKPKPLDLSPGSRFFYAGRRRPVYSAAQSSHVELLSEASGEVVREWDVEAGSEVRWDGRSGDEVAGTGAYRFVADGVSASATKQRFFFGDHLFPIRGRHDLGQSQTNNFGGGRGHQGQDMFAACGTKLAVARGGTVQFAGYHAAAGNYAVVDASGTGIDHVYMHLREPALVRTGERVFTGQKLGEVGATGRATGCHLHFEMWTAPGWYEGGRPFDPLPSLESWDTFS